MRLSKRGHVYLYIFFVVSVFSIPSFSFASNEVSVEAQVRAFFEDTPVMIDIAYCESNFRQHDSNGLPLQGGYTGGMIGVFQVYQRVHAAAATALGFDIATLEGNMAYAKHLYTTSGTAPWNGAKSCWGNAPVSSLENIEPSDARIATLEAQIRQLTQLVAELKDLLEQKNVAMR